MQQSTNGGISWSTVYSGTATSTTLSGLGTGTYTYQLQACNNTANDNACTAWVAGSALVVTLPPTTAPSLSTPGSSTNGSYSVTWTGVSGQVSYNLQQQVNGGTWTAIQNNALTSWSASGEGNGTYAYRVQACDAGGCGPFSNTGTTTVLFPPASAPTLSGGGTSTNGSYSLSWTAVPTATYYSFWQNINGAGWTVPQSSSATSWSTSGEGNGSYEYIVYACNASGCSSYSNPVTETVSLIPVAPTPTVKQTSTGSFITATVTWNAVPYATTYAVREISSTATTQVYSGPNTSWSGGYAYGPLRTFQVEACNSSGCSSWQ